MISPSTARALFETLLAFTATLTENRDALVKTAQERFDAQLLAIWKERFGKRRKFTRSKAQAALPDEAARLFAEVRLSLHAAVYANECDYGMIRFLRCQLSFLAAAAEVRPGITEFLLKTAFESTYRTQGWGAGAYAEGEAQMALLDAQSYGVQGKVAPIRHKFQRGSLDGRDGWTDFEVRVTLESPLDCEILRRKPGAPLRDTVRMLLKAGRNPRVYMPFLPPGYETRVGLDAWGNDASKAAA